MTHPEIRCPMCNERGWTTFAFIDGYAAECGTFWGPSMELRQTHACRRISELLIDNALLRMGVAA
jgi:hypothetical protein